MKIAVVGAGSWGTTIADLLGRNGNSVKIWAKETQVVEGINRNSRNPLFASDLEIHERVLADSSLERVVRDAELCIFAVPSQFVRKIVESVRDFLPPATPVVNLAKGLDESGQSLSEVIQGELGKIDRVAVLSGPNLALEVAARKPGASVIACPDRVLGKMLQEVFSTEFFRIYRNTDRKGVELGGTLKNIFAIGAGLVEGLNLGDNARAAYLTRSLHEMVRLGTALGGRTSTFHGLSGLGDLMATAFSPLSRNHRYGLAIALAKKDSFLNQNSQFVVEGIETARLARDWGRKLTISLPITEEICRVLFEKISPFDAIKNLMSRTLKDEEE